MFARYARRYGLPQSLHVDRDSIYRSDRQATVEEELRGQGPATQFGRAMKQLDVELILANSPQAKGRVERCNGTLQDRLVKAMRLAGVSDIAAANRLLEESFLASFNERFTAPAARPGDDAHRAATVELNEVLCEHHERTVGRDWCVQWRGTLLQIDKRHEGLSLAGKRVTSRELPGGEVQVVWQGQLLEWRRVTQRPVRPKPKPVIVNNRRWKPPASHPWKSTLPSAQPSSPTAPRPVPREIDQRTVLLR